jgi:hypothetical protein
LGAAGRCAPRPIWNADCVAPGSDTMWITVPLRHIPTPRQQLRPKAPGQRPPSRHALPELTVPPLNPDERCEAGGTLPRREERSDAGGLVRGYRIGQWKRGAIDSSPGGERGYRRPRRNDWPSRLLRLPSEPAGGDCWIDSGAITTVSGSCRLARRCKAGGTFVALRRPMSMWRVFLPVLVAACLGGGCGQMAQIECSGEV